MTSISVPKIAAITIIICILLIGIGIVIWQSHISDIQAKLDHQNKYPYSCVVPDKLWDTCTQRVQTSYGNGWSFDDPVTGKLNYTCETVYYAVIDWDNKHISTTDSDGITYYKGQIYDSNNVWRESSEWFTCPIGNK